MDDIYILYINYREIHFQYNLMYMVLDNEPE